MQHLCVTAPVSMNGPGCGRAVASLQVLHHACSNTLRVLGMSSPRCCSGRATHPSSVDCRLFVARADLRVISALLLAIVAPNRSRLFCRRYLDFHGPSPSR